MMPILALPLLAALAPGSAPGGTWPAGPPVATFSIVARDPANGDLGVGVASKFFAVGAVVPWAKSGAGAVATQAWANPSFGARGLLLMDSGLGAEEALAAMLKGDEARDQRQVALVDATGRVAQWTGRKCLEWAGGRTGDGWAAQGNILASEAVVAAMGQAFENTPGELAGRILAALEAAEKAGGDSRGRQSAAILVVREGGGYNGSDRYVDLRVDDHPDPLREMRRLWLVQQGIAASNRAAALYREGRFAEAAALARRAAEAPGADASTVYNAACFAALAGLREDALDLLGRSLKMDPKLRSLAAQDEDLASLREDPRYRKAVESR